MVGFGCAQNRRGRKHSVPVDVSQLQYVQLHPRFEFMLFALIIRRDDFPHAATNSRYRLAFGAHAVTKHAPHRVNNNQIIQCIRTVSTCHIQWLLSSEWGEMARTQVGLSVVQTAGYHNHIV